SMDMFFFSTSVNTPFFVFSPENIPISHPLLFPFSQYGAQDTARPNYCFPFSMIVRGFIRG
ncbi:hypothetical protein, partial [Bilophila wadsworthia]|uniref:hypothetical protein n=1 Tax=Bilophila wadsworthia TaxID=35833 RepID=UPI003C6C3467